MDTMTPLLALKNFFGKGASRPLDNPELVQFWRVLSEAERAEFAASAAKQLGVELIYQAAPASA